MNSKEQNIADREKSRPSQGVEEPADKISKNMNASWKEAYGQKASPDAGSRVPAGKNRGEEDSLHGGMKKESVQEAHATPGATLKAIAKQCGHPSALPDNYAHTNSGGDANSATDPDNFKEK